MAAPGPTIASVAAITMRINHVSEFCIPALRGKVQSLGVCMVAHEPVQRAIDWVNARPATEYAAEFNDTESGEKRWIELTLEVWDGKTIHFHVELSRSKPDDPGETRSLEEILRDCDEFLALAEVQKAFVRVREEVELPVSDLAPTVREFLHSATNTAFSLNSVSLDLDDDVFYSLALQMRKPLNVGAALCAIGGDDIPLEPEICDRMADVMRYGIDKFVLGKTPDGVEHV
jgi:hypothetical protein